MYSNYGDAERAAVVAEAGVAIVPSDAISTKLRLEGNVAITRTWLAGPLDAVVRECQRIAVEAAARGLEHFAAIGFHNAGEMQLRMGEIDKAIANLEKCARFWSETPTNPFAHNEELTSPGPCATAGPGGGRRKRRNSSDSTVATAVRTCSLRLGQCSNRRGTPI